MIRIEDLAYRYPEGGAGLDGIGLRVADGELLLVAGASGSGKSTLARAVTGIVPHLHGGTLRGRVEVFGRDVACTPPRALAGTVGFVGQDPEAGMVVDRVADEIAFTMENLGIDPLVMRRRLEEVLDALGLAPLRDRTLSSLSGGERQRVAIAAALAAQPRCLILDEPTSQLDPQSAEEVLAAVTRLNADLGLAVLLIEHRLERVVQAADRMLVLDGGRAIVEGPPREVLRMAPAAPPLAIIARERGWDPFPLTVREGRAHAAPLREHLRRHLSEPLRTSLSEYQRTLPAALSPLRTPAPGAPVAFADGIRVALGGREVIRGVDLRVDEGETVAVCGRNGSGKTTLLRTLAGLLRPHAGRVEVCGQDPRRVPLEQIARSAGYLPQSADVLLHCETVRDEIASTASGRRLAAARADRNAGQAGEAIEDLLEEYRIADLADREPRSLSVGQRQRVALAAATAGARLLLLDEPTRGVDAAGKDRLVEDLGRWREQGRAAVLVTHDVELLARCATRVVMLAEGEVVLDGPVAEALGESPLFSSQMQKIFGDRRILTVEHARAALEGIGASPQEVRR